MYEYQYFGVSADNEGGFAMVARGGGLGVGVPVAQTGCLAPDGSVNINFLQAPPTPPGGSGAVTYAATDALYGSITLGFQDGTFSYTNASQLASGGAQATTSLVPFADGDCAQSLDGYAIQSAATEVSEVEDNLLLYLGPAGTVVGLTNWNANTLPLSNEIIGMVQPAQAIDLSAVTKLTFKGFYLSEPNNTANLAYFGASSAWLTSPVFSQGSTTLVGGNTAFSQYSQPTPATGNILLSFGVQDSNHPGLFPSATIEEPDPGKVCPAAQRSTVKSATYCTFPVVALVGQSYGQYAIFIAGREPVTSGSLFYTLIQDGSSL